MNLYIIRYVYEFNSDGYYEQIDDQRPNIVVAKTITECAWYLEAMVDAIVKSIEKIKFDDDEHFVDLYGDHIYLVFTAKHENLLYDGLDETPELYYCLSNNIEDVISNFKTKDNEIITDILTKYYTIGIVDKSLDIKYLIKKHKKTYELLAK